MLLWTLEVSSVRILPVPTVLVDTMAGGQCWRCAKHHLLVSHGCGRGARQPANISGHLREFPATMHFEGCA